MCTRRSTRLLGRVIACGHRSPDSCSLARHSPIECQVMPARFIAPFDPVATTSCLAIPIAMVPIKDVHGVSSAKMDQEPTLVEAAVRRRSTGILVKAKPSMERLFRAFEDGLSKTSAVFGRRKREDGKVALMADIVAYRAIDEKPSTTTKKASYQSLGRSFSTSLLHRPPKRRSMDSGFSWSPKTWSGAPDAPANNATQSSASSSPRTIRRRPRLPDFRLSSLSHFKHKPTVEITASLSSSDHKRSDSEESWGNVASGKKQGGSTQHSDIVTSFRALNESRAEISHGIRRISTLRLLKDGSAWGAMKRMRSRKSSCQNTVNSMATSTLESMSDLSNVSSYELCDMERKQGKQDARNEALAILEGRFASWTS